MLSGTVGKCDKMRETVRIINNIFNEIEISEILQHSNTSIQNFQYKNCPFRFFTQFGERRIIMHNA